MQPAVPSRSDARVRCPRTPRSYWFVLKMAATWFSYWTGIPGGIFAPNIAIGAGIGRFLHRTTVQYIAAALHLAVDEPVCASLAATAYFAGVTQSPMTAFAIISGMFPVRSNQQSAMLAAAVIGWICSRAIAPSPLYGALASSRLPPLPPESLECDLKKLPEPGCTARASCPWRAPCVPLACLLRSPALPAPPPRAPACAACAACPVLRAARPLPKAPQSTWSEHPCATLRAMWRRYVSKDDSKRLAHFVEVSQSYASTVGGPSIRSAASGRFSISRRRNANGLPNTAEQPAVDESGMEN